MFSFPVSKFIELCSLFQKLAADLRTTLLPEYHNLLSFLLVFLPKNISTNALDILLATIAAFFKYLLVPSLQSSPKLLETTWEELCSTFPKCLPDIQRAMAEVWGTLLRRLKGNEMKEKAMTLLAQNLEGLESSWATAFVYACKASLYSTHANVGSFYFSLFRKLCIHAPRHC